MSEARTVKALIAMALRNGRSGGRKMKREEATLQPFTPEQVDVIHHTVLSEINDPGITYESGVPKGLKHESWTLLVARLLWTIAEQRAQIVRAQGALADVQQALWVPENQAGPKPENVE